MKFRNAEDLQDSLVEMFFDTFDDQGKSKVLTYGEAGIMTHDWGLVIKDSEGNEYQLTIVKSK